MKLSIRVFYLFLGLQSGQMLSGLSKTSCTVSSLTFFPRNLSQTSDHGSPILQYKINFLFVS